jgi:hypothetical protein
LIRSGRDIEVMGLAIVPTPVVVEDKYLPPTSVAGTVDKR